MHEVRVGRMRNIQAARNLKAGFHESWGGVAFGDFRFCIGVGDAHGPCSLLMGPVLNELGPYVQQVFTMAITSW